MLEWLPLLPELPGCWEAGGGNSCARAGERPAGQQPQRGLISSHALRDLPVGVQVHDEDIGRPRLAIEASAASMGTLHCMTWHIQPQGMWVSHKTHTRLDSSMRPSAAAGARVLSAGWGGCIRVLNGPLARGGRGQAGLPGQLALRAQRLQHCICPLSPSVRALPGSGLHQGSWALTRTSSAHVVAQALTYVCLCISPASRPSCTAGQLCIVPSSSAGAIA